MKTIQVTYTVQAGFAAQNKINIQAVMTDLQQLHRAGLLYHACIKEDDKTFIHTAIFQSDDDQNFLNELAAFKFFQQQLKASGLEVPPKQEILILIGSSTSF